MPLKFNFSPAIDLHGARRIRQEYANRQRTPPKPYSTDFTSFPGSSLRMRSILTDEKRLVRQFLYDPLKLFRLANRSPLDRRGSPGLTNGKCAGRVAANRG